MYLMYDGSETYGNLPAFTTSSFYTNIETLVEDGKHQWWNSFCSTITKGLVCKNYILEIIVLKQALFHGQMQTIQQQ